MNNNPLTQYIEEVEFRCPFLTCDDSGEQRVFFNNVLVKNIISTCDCMHERSHGVETEVVLREKCIKIELLNGNVIQIHNPTTSICFDGNDTYVSCDLNGIEYTIDISNTEDNIELDHDCKESDMSIEELIGDVTKECH